MGHNQFLACDAFVRTNLRGIAILSVCPSVRFSVCLGRACIVIIWCTLVQILVYCWIVQCYGHLDTKSCLPTPSHLFPVPPAREVGYGYAN